MLEVLEFQTNNLVDERNKTILCIHKGICLNFLELKNKPVIITSSKILI